MNHKKRCFRFKFGITDFFELGRKTDGITKVNRGETLHRVQ